mmetsp:Transcript_10175/g.35141  ORF Transcript_10175/g.35141 Transcript_10175/m.35141 type:complete len:253 (-) Transcript_10175:1408-2166(-)
MADGTVSVCRALGAWLSPAMLWATTMPLLPITSLSDKKVWLMGLVAVSELLMSVSEMCWSPLDSALALIDWKVDSSMNSTASPSLYTLKTLALKVADLCRPDSSSSFPSSASPPSAAAGSSSATGSASSALSSPGLSASAWGSDPSPSASSATSAGAGSASAAAATVPQRTSSPSRKAPDPTSAVNSPSVTVAAPSSRLTSRVEASKGTLTFTPSWSVVSTSSLPMQILLWSPLNSRVTLLSCSMVSHSPEA